MARAVSHRVDTKGSAAALAAAKIPIYPGATPDETFTQVNGKAFGALIGLLGDKGSVAAVGFDTSAPPLDVRRWYGEKLPALGFKEDDAQERRAFGSRIDQVQYVRGDETLFIQFTTDPARKGSVFLLARLTGLTKKNR